MCSSTKALRQASLACCLPALQGSRKQLSSEQRKSIPRVPAKHDMCVLSTLPASQVHRLAALAAAQLPAFQKFRCVGTKSFASLQPCENACRYM